MRGTMEAGIFRRLGGGLPSEDDVGEEAVSRLAGLGQDLVATIAIGVHA